MLTAKSFVVAGLIVNGSLAAATMAAMLFSSEQYPTGFVMLVCLWLFSSIAAVIAEGRRS
jgi:hypothetical protein